MDSQRLAELARVRQLCTSGSARVRREAARLSLAEVATPVEVTPTTVWRWERGQRKPRGDAALRYLAVLDSLTPTKEA